MADANETTRYLFEHHLSRSLHLEPPLPTPPALELTLDITHFARLICLTRSGSVYADDRVVAREERVDRITSPLGLLSRIPDLPPELHPLWEESISSYAREAMKGVEAGRVRVVVRVEVIRETTATDDEADWTEEELTVLREEYAFRMATIEASLEEITAEGRGDDESTCAVCLEEFGSPGGGEEVRVARMLRCSHAFHRECVVEWLLSHPTCPLCRSEISGLLKLKVKMLILASLRG